MRQDRNPVETIAALAPATIGWLQVPLTPARKAALDAMQVRDPDFDPALAVADFLDDIIFSKPQG